MLVNLSLAARITRTAANSDDRQTTHAEKAGRSDRKGDIRKLPITNHRQRNDMGAEREGNSQNQRGTSELAFKGCPTSDTASSARGRRDGDSDELEDMLEDEHDIWTEMGGGGPPPQYE